MHLQSRDKSYCWLCHNCLSVCPSAWNSSFPRELILVIFYTEKLYYNSVEEVQIGLISDKNIRHYSAIFYCYWEKHLLLGETPLGKHIASIFAQNRTITCKGSLLRRVRKEPLSLVRLRPCISLCSICASSRQATIVSPYKWNILRHFHRHD
jgi:ferredoxin